MSPDTVSWFPVDLKIRFVNSRTAPLPPLWEEIKEAHFLTASSASAGTAERPTLLSIPMSTISSPHKRNLFLFIVVIQKNLFINGDLVVNTLVHFGYSELFRPDGDDV